MAKANSEQDKILYRALQFRDKHVSLAEEATETASNNPPVIKMREKKAQISEQDLTALCTFLLYDIQTPYPILFVPFANIGIGSHHEGTEGLIADIEDFILDNPHIVTAFLSNIIYSNSAKKDSRDEILNRYIELVNLIGSERVLALMFDAKLGHSSWNKMLRNSAPIFPGARLTEATGVPLTTGKVSLDLNIGKHNEVDSNTSHRLLLLERTKYNSVVRPFYGLSHNLEGHDVIASGYDASTSGVGREQDGDRLVHLLKLGGYAQFSTRDNKIDVFRTAEPGQAILLHDTIRYAFSNWIEFEDLYPALFSYLVADELGMLKGLD